MMEGLAKKPTGVMSETVDDSNPQRGEEADVSSSKIITGEVR